MEGAEAPFYLDINPYRPCLVAKQRSIQKIAVFVFSPDTEDEPLFFTITVSKHLIGPPFQRIGLDGRGQKMTK